MSKKTLGLNGGTKLIHTSPPLPLQKEKTANLSLIRQKSKPAYPKSYRLNQEDIERLRKILSSVNECASSRFFSETDIIRGLLVMGEKTKPEKIISSIKESF